jgi:hypothetical protein
MHLAPAPALSGPEIMLWSAAVGAAAVPMLLACIDSIFNRTRAAWQTFAYLSLCWLAYTALTGLPNALWPAAQLPEHLAQVLLGPFCAAVGCYGVSRWLYASKRDRVTHVVLMAMTMACMVGGPLCVFLEASTRVAAAGTLSITSMAAVLWVAVRAGQRGDRLAWGLAGASVLTLTAQIGVYQMALSSQRPPLAWQAAVAVFGLAALLTTGLVLWLRSQQIRRLNHDDSSRRDPATRLFGSVVMLQKIIASQKNRRLIGGDGALMAVMLFDPEFLVTQVGHSGLADIYTELALRMQRETDVINPAGRYYDRCFLVLFETLHSPDWLRTLGLRVACSLRQPIEAISLNGERVLITADIGVGVIHVSEVKKDVDQLLHEVQRTAVAARDMQSRAAVFDPVSRKAVAAESADLGSRWRTLRSAQKTSERERTTRRSKPPRTSLGADPVAAEDKATRPM